MNIYAEFRPEEDGRWIAEIPQLSEAHVYAPTRHDAAIALAVRAFHILAERAASGELKVEDEPGAIILGDTAASFSELLVRLQSGHTRSPEPIAATEEGDTEGVASFRSDEEPPTGSSVAEEIDRFAAAIADTENSRGLPSPA